MANRSAIGLSVPAGFVGTMGFLESFMVHIQELLRRLKIVAIVFVILFGVVVTLELRSTDVAGTTLPLPWPNIYKPIALQFFSRMVDDLVPPTVNTTVTGPLDGIVVEMKMGMFLAVAFTMPLFVYEMGAFLAPALKPQERRIILLTVGPATLLFLTGMLFAYFYVLPFTFEFLYLIGLSISDLQLLKVDDFVDFVLMFLLAFGAVFELPVVMAGITKLGVVRAEFWKKYWRFAVIGIFVFAAVITPDGSGVTMILVAAPMLLLYLIGYAVSTKVGRRTATPVPGT